MSRYALIIAAIAGAFLAAPARAEFSEEWLAMADQIKAECDAFADVQSSADEVELTVAGNLKFPAHPGPPSRPHACIFVRFDVNAVGETENVELVFKSPDNLRYSFVREVVNAAKKWRFVVPAEAPAGISDNFAEMEYIPLGNYRYNGRLRLQGGKIRSSGE